MPKNLHELEGKIGEQTEHNEKYGSNAGQEERLYRNQCVFEGKDRKEDGKQNQIQSKD